MKKRVIIIVSAVLAAAVLAGLAFFIIGADDGAPSVNIKAKNLAFKNGVYLMFAVECERVPAGAEKGLLIWRSAQDEYTYENAETVLTDSYVEKISGTDCDVYLYSDLAARHMTDTVYTVAYVKSGGDTYYSKPVKYSVLQYAYNKLGRTGTATADKTLQAMLLDMLTYGAKAQIYDKYKPDRPADADFYQVRAVGGVLEDGFDSGLYLPGDRVTLTAPETAPDGGGFLRWQDSAGRLAGADTVCTVTVGRANEVYTAVYGEAVSSGLAYTPADDGTCLVSGVGSCTDSRIVIPVHGPDGRVVSGIADNAFTGKPITAVTIPATVTSIGKSAFNRCGSLKDVYYAGSTAGWESIEKGALNASLTSAALHPGVTAETYTVIFADEDGTELGRAEGLLSGEDAALPADPVRDGYTFIGWSGSARNVTSDRTLTARYAEGSGLVIAAGQAEAAAGGDVEVAVDVFNNPGILGMTLTLSYDDSMLTLTGVTQGSALRELTFTPPARPGSGSKYLWDGGELRPEDVTNGPALILHFSVSADTPAGEYGISLSYTDGAIVDNDLQPIDARAVSGSVTVTD